MFLIIRTNGQIELIKDTWPNATISKQHHLSLSLMFPR